MRRSKAMPLINCSFRRLFVLCCLCSDSRIHVAQAQVTSSYSNIITYSNYPDIEMSDISQQCNGYPTPFAEEAFITLYGPGASEEFSPSDGEIFLDILLSTLQDCANPCIHIDEVSIEEEELQKFEILGFDFPGGDNGAGRALLLDDNNTTNGTSLLQSRELQLRKLGKRKIRRANMRGRKYKRKKNKDKKKKDDRVRVLQEEKESILPLDNECGVLFMERLYETGRPAFECIFANGAFITSCDPSAVALLTSLEDLVEP